MTAFEQGWTIVKYDRNKAWNAHLWHSPDQDQPSPGEEGYDRLKAKIYNNTSLEPHESIDDLGIPTGHSWSMGGQAAWEAGNEPPKCSFCDASVYHAPIRGNLNFMTCNDYDCTDKALRKVGEDGYDELSDVELFRMRNGKEQSVGHFGGQEWDQW